MTLVTLEDNYKLIKSNMTQFKPNCRKTNGRVFKTLPKYLFPKLLLTISLHVIFQLIRFSPRFLTAIFIFWPFKKKKEKIIFLIFYVTNSHSQGKFFPLRFGQEISHRIQFWGQNFFELHMREKSMKYAAFFKSISQKLVDKKSSGRIQITSDT